MPRFTNRQDMYICLYEYDMVAREDRYHLYDLDGNIQYTFSRLDDVFDFAIKTGAEIYGRIK